eukprot:CAMPEP_0114352568 /NCGR_PEP_ID=MMETSP0101-20121206/18038_1 /TAXON_ID=38822 ORGANISM="Pteridomonas danica, Strain PT" /NCGR_SAMPLE_ID=MMETSP0101 /ASSEMBLY_ACC=CAM_ASM_000211 /LENGTH=397 /DNA_ID=CAMNT_0001493023 /DNA_START=97 /DNA_END=1290 /DNA_ORIENTATION=-
METNHPDMFDDSEEEDSDNVVGDVDENIDEDIDVDEEDGGYVEDVYYDEAEEGGDDDDFENIYYDEDGEVNDEEDNDDFDDELDDELDDNTLAFLQEQQEQQRKAQQKGEAEGRKASIKRVMVFCNTVKSCRAVEYALTDGGINCAGYHGEMNTLARTSALKQFKDGEVVVLVCTDLAARGLDVPDVHQVLMFDFPRNSVDYLHRAGRTARYGKKGKVCSLVSKRDIVLATAIERAVLKDEPIDMLTSDKRDYLPGGSLSPITLSALRKSSTSTSKSSKLSSSSRFDANMKQQKNHKKDVKNVRQKEFVRRGINRGKQVISSPSRGSGMKRKSKIIDFQGSKAGHRHKGSGSKNGGRNAGKNMDGSHKSYKKKNEDGTSSSSSSGTPKRRNRTGGKK